MNINITVENQGDFTETFNVTLYANTTAIETKQVTLISGTLTTLTFTWNTTGFAKGKYTIWAYAWPVPGETETTNNTLTDGCVYVAMIGDLTGGTPNPYDFISDGKVNIRDISIIARHFGEIDP